MILSCNIFKSGNTIRIDLIDLLLRSLIAAERFKLFLPCQGIERLKAVCYLLFYRERRLFRLLTEL